MRLGEINERREFITVRSRARFTPLPRSSLSEQLHFSDPVVLLRAPFRLSFAYAGEDRIWKNTWRESDTLPTMVRLTVRDAVNLNACSRCRRSRRIIVQLASDCVRPDSGCDSKTDAPQKAPDENRSGTTAAGQGGSQ